jgi:hypothetical protein
MMRNTYTIAVVMICCYSSLALAQDHPATHSVPVQTQAATSIMTPHRTAADTGRMTWGHQDYSRYTSADACDGAVRDMTAEIWRTHVVDTLPYDVHADTLPTAAVTVAHACAGHFNVSSTNPSELWSLLRLSVEMGNAHQAEQVVEHQMSLAQTPADKAHVLSGAIQTYLSAHPPMVAQAQRLLPQLDAIGSAAPFAQYGAHSAFMHYWHSVYNADSLRQEAKTSVALLKKMTPDERDMVNVFQPYMELIFLASTAHDLATQKTLINQGLADVGAWREGRGSDRFLKAERLLETQTSLYGKATRALNGKYWFNDGGTPHPAPGKVSLLIHVDHSCGMRCYPLYAVIRYLSKKYGQNLDITLITDTKGYAPGTGPLLPDQEAPQVSHYYLDFLKLPTALLVDVSPTVKQPDGHIEHQPSPIGQMFDEWQLINTVLIDRDGKIQWLGELSSADDQRMAEFAIDRALGHGQTASTTPATH